MGNAILKRGFDIIVSSVGLVLLSPLFGVISIVIRLTDKGPVFFRQKRVGQGGRIFVMYKFRSMKALGSAEAGLFEPGDNSRVTPLGAFIRRRKIDEIPQLLNVLVGDMSMVGPRPEIQKWVEEFPERWKKILTVKPGITDNASISFINEETILAESDDPQKCYREVILPAKLDLYEDYIDNNSILNDFKILLLTTKKVINRL